MDRSPEFPTTRWSLVLQASAETGRDPTGQQSADQQSKDALAALSETYWYPLYAYIRRRGYTVEQAQDLTQEFFTRLLEKRYFEQADRTKGRFRSFLLNTLKYFLSDEIDRERALKRGGNRPALPFEVRSGEEFYQREVSHNETPESIFERRWAMALLERVVVRLRNEFVQNGRADHFEKLKLFLLGRGVEVPYTELSAELGTSEGALRVAIHRFRKRYRDLLRAEIAQTVESPEEVDEELRFLAGALNPK